MFCELQQEKSSIEEFAEKYSGRTPSRLQIHRLQQEMVSLLLSNKEMRPTEDHIKTDHYMVPGMYCRRVWRKKGVAIVGKIHKAPHFFMCLMGEIEVRSEHGIHTMKAGDVIECKPGTKRATLALTDAIGVTVHKTDKTDLDEIESELIEPDDTALFDSGNRLKYTLLTGETP